MTRDSLKGILIEFFGGKGGRASTQEVHGGGETARHTPVPASLKHAFAVTSLDSNSPLMTIDPVFVTVFLTVRGLQVLREFSPRVPTEAKHLFKEVCGC